MGIKISGEGVVEFVDLTKKGLEENDRKVMCMGAAIQGAVSALFTEGFTESGTVFDLEKVSRLLYARDLWKMSASFWFKWLCLLNLAAMTLPNIHASALNARGIGAGAGWEQACPG